ncbi:MAG: glycosyltransferase family A protein [Cyanobacteria bacterium P01_H01_bin.15]
MNKFTPCLSIISPTREGFSQHWLASLLKIKGNVELILVNPPGLDPHPTNDPRLIQIVSPLRGEMIQRMTGLLSASGQYTLTINCDEYLHPDILAIAKNYFEQYPDSWMVRLRKAKNVQFGEIERQDLPWGSLMSCDDMKVLPVDKRLNVTPTDRDVLAEIPIAPLNYPFKLRTFLKPRQDQHGRHTENFDKKIWKTELVKSALSGIYHSLKLLGPIKYVPFWCLDRLLGLSLQARFFEEGKIIGHHLPWPEQLRTENNPPEYRAKNRYYVLAEILLVRQYPQYGYLWNLMVEHAKDVMIMLRQDLGFKSKTKKAPKLSAKQTNVSGKS